MTDAGQEQVPVEKLLRQEQRQPAPTGASQWRVWLNQLVRWRDWKLPVKLAAVTLVPIVIALALGISTLSDQVARTNGYERVDSAVKLSKQLGVLLDRVQEERTQTAARLSKGIGTSSAMKEARAAVDASVDPFTDAADTAVELNPGLGGAVSDAKNALDQVKAAREDVATGQLDPVQSIEELSAVTDVLLSLDEATAARVDDADVGGALRALGDVREAKEEVSVQQALVGYGISRGVLTPTELSQIRSSEVRIDDRVDDFNAIATSAQRQLFDKTVSAPSFATRDRLVRAVLGELGTSSDEAIQQISQREWSNSSGRVVDEFTQVASQLSAGSSENAGTLVSDSRTGVGVLAAVLLAAFALALAVVFVITRHLLRSLKVLHSGAMEIAEERLPETVRDIQDGKVTSTQIEPVPVHSGDELGEVARTFDAVHTQALRLAVEQVGMRTAYSTVFVNLSRRSQSLVQRQLQLIERLERDEEDADQLATLFQLDHLATRMRRNNENLMVLSGSESARRSGRPVSTADVLRAAVSEIEQYQRVVVQSPPTTKVVGHGASDLMRLLAELLDNATAFSPPETQVTVATNVGDNGSMTIDILDKGIGMNAAEVAEANARMAEASAMDLVASRRMGLFVVGRLANRHGIDVRLHGGKGIEGVRAAVTVPADLVLGTDGGPLTSEMPVVSDTGPLPHRQSSPKGEQPASLSSFGGPLSGKLNVKGRNDSPSSTTSAHVGSSAANGTAGKPSKDVEISGTALFSPISDDAQSDGTSAQGVKRADDSAKPLPKRVPKNGTADHSRNGSKPHKDELPSGEALFKPGTSALSDWWSTTASSAPSRPLSDSVPVTKSEITPIFDEMLSLWFRTSSGPRADTSVETEQQDRAWDFAADAHWRTVEEISQKAAPSSFTEAGLPRRKRGEQLLPGSATPERITDTPSRSVMGRVDLPVRDPNDVRTRLSSFQRGVGKARNQRGKYQDHPDAEARNAKTQTTQPTEGRTTFAAKADTDHTDAVQNGTAATEAWSFSSDADWSSARSVAEAEPAAFTEAGLPRRRRGEQLVPGSASAMTRSRAPAKGPRAGRDPDALRGRLSSFQQGIRRGRQTSTQPTDSKAQENGG